MIYDIGYKPEVWDCANPAICGQRYITVVLVASMQLHDSVTSFAFVTRLQATATQNCKLINT